MEDQDNVRTQLIKFIGFNDYLTNRALAHLIGCDPTTLDMFAFGSRKIVQVEPLVERFLKSEGKRLTDIRIQLRTGSGNRITLHQQRKQILNAIKS